MACQVLQLQLRVQDWCGSRCRHAGPTVHGSCLPRVTHYSYIQDLVGQREHSLALGGGGQLCYAFHGLLRGIIWWCFILIVVRVCDGSSTTRSAGCEVLFGVHLPAGSTVCGSMPGLVMQAGTHGADWPCWRPARAIMACPQGCSFGSPVGLRAASGTMAGLCHWCALAINHQGSLQQAPAMQHVVSMTMYRVVGGPCGAF
jgi:hypothetical protein